MLEVSFIFRASSLAPEVLGLLVLLSFDISAFTPATYLRRRLQQPYMEISS